MKYTIGLDHFFKATGPDGCVHWDGEKLSFRRKYEVAQGSPVEDEVTMDGKEVARVHIHEEEFGIDDDSSSRTRQIEQ